MLRYLKTLARSKGPVDTALLAYMERYSSELAAEGSSRWISAKGDRIDVFVIVDASAEGKIKFDEAARSSRIESDLSSLFGTVFSIATLAAVPKAPPPVYFRKFYNLRQKRATLTVTASATNAAPAADSGGGAGGAKGGSARNATPTKSEGDLTASITTGPVERFFLSANLGTSDAKQTTYNQDTKSLTPPKTAKEVYLGANVSLGDLYDDSGTWWPRFYRSIYVGGFLEASSKPFNQYGVVAGFRYFPVPALNDIVPISSISPYFGFVRVRNDTVAVVNAQPTGGVATKYSGWKAIFGLSFNLSHAAGWLGAGDGGGGGSSGSGGKGTHGE